MVQGIDSRGARQMLRFDHLTVIAPSLVEGVEHVRACLDLDIPMGGAHPEMGTHNHVLRVGDDTYLEVIAVDPAAPAPAGPRWFGLGDAASVRAHWERGERLRGWVARTDGMDAVLAAHGELFGGWTTVSRGGQISRFSLLSDGALPMGGALPSVIDRGGRPSPVPGMPDLGARLLDVTLEHPSPEEIAALYARVGIDQPPRVQAGLVLRYHARIETASGVRTLH